MTPVPVAVTRILRVVALFTTCLMVSTWPLWWNARGVVQIPWFTALLSVPHWVDTAALVSVSIGIAGLLRGNKTVLFTRNAAGLIALGLLILVALDQHRFQPWVCQFLLCLGLLMLTPTSIGVKWWRIVIASIYLWSAVSKFDAAFLTSHGELLLTGMLKPLGIPLTYWSPSSRMAATSLFPIGEMLIGLLLLNRRTYAVGLPASIGMHLLLLWTLGIGLQHEWSVLLWNLFFIMQNILIYGPESGLFRRREPNSDETADNSNGRLMLRRYPLQAMLATGFAIVSVSYPALELIGDCDHWPAWAVYSSRPAIVKVSLTPDAAQALPASLKTFLGREDFVEERVPFSLDAWSFQNCFCPVYPQLRYRLGLIEGLLADHVPDDAIRVEIGLTPDRLTGKREKLRLNNMKEVRNYSRKFWGNTQTRSRTSANNLP